MDDKAKVTLHLDLNTSEAQRKQDKFISQNQNLKANLTFDISQALQSFQSFAKQIQNQPVKARLLLDGTQTPQAMTTLHLATDAAKTQMQNFISGIQNLNAVLTLDTSQAVQRFQDFVNQVKTTPVDTALKLENKNQQMITNLKLETDQARIAFQNFASQIRTQNITADLRLNLSQAKADIQRLANQSITVRLNYRNQPKTSVSLNLDTASANRKLDVFLQKIKNANPVLRLQFDVNSARSRFDSFRNHVRNTDFNARLNLNTSDAQRSLTELLNRIGSTDLNLKNADRNMNNLNGTAQKLGNTLKSLFATGAVIAWGKACISAATGTENAFRGLQSIISGQGRDFAQAQGFIQEYISDGLIPLQNAVTAYKNLAVRGYSDTQIQNVLTALKDSAAYGRQSRYSIGEAVASATEGLKNENSILVDNAGVTKNVAKMWQDYAKSIGTTSAKLTQAQKIQAEVNGILEETRFQSGDAAKIADSFSGKLSRLTASLTAFKTAVGNILTGALSPLISFLTEAIRKATELTETLGRMLGFTGFQADISSGFSAGISSAVTKTDSLTESLETAQKAAENLGSASFDDFNIIGVQDSDDSESETEPEITPVLNPSGVQSGLSEIENQFSERLKNLFQPMQNAWNVYGQPLLNSIRNAGDQIKNLFSEIGQSFAEVWMNGTGERLTGNLLILLTDVYHIIGDIAGAFASAWQDNGRGTALIQSYADNFNHLLELIHAVNTAFRTVWNGGIGEEIFGNILEILTNINRIFENLEKRFQTAWERNQTGERIFSGILEIMNTVLESANHITEKTAEFADQIDFSPLLNSFADVLESLEPLTGHIGEGLEWFWENILLPIAGFTIENLIPDFLNILSGAIDILDASIEALKPFGLWLWDEFIKPLADWTGDIITTGIENLAKALHKIGDWIRNNPDASVYIAGFTAAVTGLYTAITGGTFAAMAGKIAAFAGKLATLDVTTGILIIGFASWGYAITELWNNWDDLCDVFEDSGGAFGFISGWLEYIREDVEEFFNFGDFGQIWYNFWSGLGETLYTITHEMWDGFKKGIQEKWSAIKTNVKEWIFDPFMESVRALFGIHSPSKVMAEIGNFLIDGLYNGVSEGIQKIKEIFEKMRNRIEEIFQNLPEWFSQKFDQARKNIQNIFSTIGGYFSDRWKEITEVFLNSDNWFAEKFDQAKENIETVFQNIGDYFSDRWNEITGIFLNSDNWFSEKFASAFEKIRTVFSEAGNLFSQIWSEIQSPFARTADWFREIFSTAWEAVKQVFSSGGAVFQGIQTGISDVFKNTVNSLIDGINQVVRVPFQGISEALSTVRGWWLWTPWGDFFPFQNLPEISIPEIPHLAKGGLVRQPTLAMIGDNVNARSDPEIVSPLSKLKNLLPEQNQNQNLMLESKLDTLIQLTEILISTIEENQPVITIGDKDIYTASERGRRKFSHMKGVR